jgi:uroporphyrinogen decarboxylase
MIEENFAEINRERMLMAIEHKEPDSSPVFPLINGPFCSYFSGVPLKEYYNEAKKMLKAQLIVRERFYNLTPIWADFGTILEASALGADIHWDLVGNPQPKPLIINIDEIDELEVPDPKHDGLMPKAQKIYEYMIKNVEKGMKVDFGYYVLGPATLAGLLRGMNQFLIDLFKSPDLIRKLLKICTDTHIIWAKAVRDIIGETEYGIFMNDDAASFLTPKQFKDFILPLYKKIYGEFPKARKWYHNDMDATHLLELLADSGVEVFNPSYDLDLISAKKRVGDKICFLGNIPPLEILKEGTVQIVKKTCTNLIRNMRKMKDGGFILSTGGYINTGTPPENLDAMIESVEDCS